MTWHGMAWHRIMSQFPSLTLCARASAMLAQELIDLLRKLCGSSGQDFSIYEAVLRMQSKIPSEARLMCYCGNGKSSWYDNDDHDHGVAFPCDAAIGVLVRFQQLTRVTSSLPAGRFAWMERPSESATSSTLRL